MAITEANQPLGFWLFVHDEESGVYASRLCGLPVFLTGLWALVLALLTMIGEQAPATMGAAESNRTLGFLLIGCAFVATGLLIRARFFSLVPIMATLFLLMCATAIVAASGLIISQAEATSDFDTLPLPAAVLAAPVSPALFCLMMISGLRGWCYLRKHGSKRA